MRKDAARGRRTGIRVTRDCAADRSNGDPSYVAHRNRVGQSQSGAGVTVAWTVASGALEAMGWLGGHLHAFEADGVFRDPRRRELRLSRVPARRQWRPVGIRQPAGCDQ